LGAKERGTAEISLVYEIRSVYPCGKRMLGVWCEGC